jgi:hypothetical protein
MRILILLLFPLFSYSQLSIGILESSRFFVADSTAPKAFIIAANITDGTQISAIYSLAFGLQQKGLWTKMKAIYPMVGGSASSHKYNLKDPRDLDAAYRLLFSGAWTHSSGGAKGDGTSAFANSYLNTSTLGIDNIHVSYSIRNPNTNYGLLWGISNTVNAVTRLANTFYSVNDLTSDTYTNSKLINFSILTRNAVNSKKIYIDGSIAATATTASVATATNPIYLNAENLFNSAISFSNAECSFASIGDGLSDADATNFNTLVQNFNTTLNRQIIIPTVSDADAQLFLYSAVITNTIQANAINDLVVGLKADGIWTKMKAIYPMVGGSASSHKYNLKDPRDLDAAFRLLFVGGWTHSSTGATPNGTSGYAITYLNPSTSLTISSAHFSKYNRTNDLAGNKIDGIFDGLTSFFQQNYSAGNGIIGDIGTIGSYTQTDTRGLFTSTRTAANVYKVFKNSTQVATNTSTNTTIPNYNFWIGARNNANSALFYNTYECAFASIGDGLTDTDAANFYTRVQAYQTSLSRQINP